MSLMEDWEVLANQYNTDQATAQKFWTDYYMQEKSSLREDADRTC